MGRLPAIARAAALDAAKAYAGAPPYIAAAGIVQARFTKSNTHGFAPLSDRPRFVRVKTKAGKWIAFMAPGYATWKRKRFGNKPILVATGRLREALAGAKCWTSGNTVIITFMVPEYGQYHQTGTKHMPKRSPIEADAEDVRRVREKFRDAFAINLMAQRRSLGLPLA
jgi:hypothetical protein